MTTKEKIYDYILKKYSTKPEHPWFKFPSYAVFRHADNEKWYGLIMDIPRSKLGLIGDEYVNVLNIKAADSFTRDILVQREGYFPGYHIARGNWVSVLLDGTVAADEIYTLIDMSFMTTASKKERDKHRAPKEWIIPSNPKYFDIISAFNKTDTINWKQGKGIKAGDTVFMYVGAPISAVLYKCKVLETDIPYGRINKNINITALMTIKLEKRYPEDKFTFEILKNEYEIFAVRGPRGIPKKLSEDLNK